MTAMRRYLGMILLAAIGSLLLPPLGFPPRGMASEQSQPRPPPRPPLRLEMFADRPIVKQGERITLTVWVESRHVDTATIVVFFAQEHLTLVGDPSLSVRLPAEGLRTFTFLANRPGKSNMFVHATGINTETNEIVGASGHIQGIEVQAGLLSVGTGFSSSLLGVILGALLTLGTTWLNERRQRRKEEAQRKRWVTEDLPAQLAFDRGAVLAGRGTTLDSWRGKLLTEGYYGELEKLTAQHPTLRDLGQESMRVGFRLQEYEERRVRARLDKPFQDDLAAQLADLIRRIGELRGTG